MPPIKELHYFDRSPLYSSPNKLSETKLHKRLGTCGYVQNASKIIYQCLRSRNYRRARWWSNYFFRDYSDIWYKQLFKSENGITGDVTPSYSILDQEDVARLHKVVPCAKIVFLLRNPIDRAWSMYRYGEKSGRSLKLNDLTAFKNFVDSPAQELRSNYLRTIDLFLHHFDSSQLLLGYYDAIADQPAELLSEVLKHIGASDTRCHKNLHKVVNKSRRLDMPEEYRNYLIDKYSDDLDELARRYGGYPSRWLSNSKNIDAGPWDGANRPPPVAHA